MSDKKSIRDYKQRRRERISDRSQHRVDSVEAYRERRAERMRTRQDAGVGWVFGALRGAGVDTTGMDVDEAFETWNKMNEGKGGNKKAEPSKTRKKAKGEEGEKKGSPSASEQGNGNGGIGEVKTGKGGKLRPKSDAARTIDVADALEETRAYKESGGARGLKKNSLSDHIGKDGKLSPERQAVHDEIISKFFAEKKSFDGKPSLILSGGGPASGKSFIRKKAEGDFGMDTTCTIDPDDFKAMLPGYSDMAQKDKKAASFYHEESSALAKRAYQYAVDNGINVVYDGTGDGSVKSVQKKLKAAQDAGYNVKGSYVTVEVEEALKRNKKRYEDAKALYDAGKSKIPPRLPPEEDVRKIHSAVSDISVQVAGMFDSFELWDNNVPQGQKPKLIAKCNKGGEIVAENGMEFELQRYLNKGRSGAKVVNGKVVANPSNLPNTNTNQMAGIVNHK